MNRETPEVIQAMQPEEYEDVASGSRRIFIKYPKKEADALAEHLSEVCKNRTRSERLLYPIGTFVGGDVVCWSGEARICVVFHDSFNVLESNVTLDEFLTRLEAKEVSLEEDVYTFGRK